MKTILFDLDGTLLPMDQDYFTKGYFKCLAGTMAKHGYDPDTLISAVWKGTAAMVKNDGSKSNEEAFWEVFFRIFGDRAQSDKAYFDDFYRQNFGNLQLCCGFNPQAAQAVYLLKQLGYRVALATNPIFPSIATEARIRWAGLQPEDFALYTTYENARFCKPNPAYYREVAEKLETAPGDCLMVGNDVGEDMIAQTVGMKVFLLTDCLINKEEQDLSAFPHGGFPQLLKYIHRDFPLF